MLPKVNSSDAPPYSVADSGVRLKSVPFNAAMYAIGVPDNITAKARALGVSDKSVSSALAGSSVGRRMISRIMVTFAQHRQKLAKADLQISMDQFFEVPELAESVS